MCIYGNENYYFPNGPRAHATVMPFVTQVKMKQKNKKLQNNHVTTTNV